MDPVLKPLQQSTTVTGLADVLLPGAQLAMALLRLMTRWPHSEQLDGPMGMILATYVYS